MACCRDMSGTNKKRKKLDFCLFFLLLDVSLQLVTVSLAGLKLEFQSMVAGQRHARQQQDLCTYLMHEVSGDNSRYLYQT